MEKVIKIRTVGLLSKEVDFTIKGIPFRLFLEENGKNSGIGNTGTPDECLVLVDDMKDALERIDKLQSSLLSIDVDYTASLIAVTTDSNNNEEVRVYYCNSAKQDTFSIGVGKMYKDAQDEIAGLFEWLEGIIASIIKEWR